ncbi:hypothetical protein P9139_07010 [Curtobacterium flaccumfaciens]|nr:hypothetical protein P9139_07010 [Curtobacterium flaccumfaciens]
MRTVLAGVWAEMRPASAAGVVSKPSSLITGPRTLELVATLTYDFTLSWAALLPCTTSTALSAPIDFTETKSSVVAL